MGAQSAEHVAFSRFAGAQEWNLFRVQMRALERNFGVVYIYDYAVYLEIFGSFKTSSAKASNQKHK